MTPGARLAAAIEILDEIIDSAKHAGASADRIVSGYFRTRRYAGSKDRRAVRELVWRAVRRFGDMPANGRAAFVALADEDARLKALFDGAGHAPEPITEDEPRSTGDSAPEWIVAQFERPEGGIQTDSLLDRAPLDVRVNRLKAERADLDAELPASDTLSETPLGLRLPTGTAVEKSSAWQDGLIEIQDHGSQLIVAACRAGADMTVLDLCAGAGGKALGLAADMAGEGTLIASDINRDRLSKLPARAERAGAGFIETRLLDPGKEAAALADLEGGCDVVLIDAPCSGTGTWRRNPETRWRLTADRLDRLVSDQARLLDLAAPLVKPGGALVYAVCSLTKVEGSGQVADFLARHRAFRPVDTGIATGRIAGAGRILTPCHDASDGFFFARLEKTA